MSLAFIFLTKILVVNIIKKEDLVVIVVQEDYARYVKLLETETNKTKIENLKEKIFQFKFFMDGRWRSMIDEKAKLYPEFREILYLERHREE